MLFRSRKRRSQWMKREVPAQPEPAPSWQSEQRKTQPVDVPLQPKKQETVQPPRQTTSKEKMPPRESSVVEDEEIVIRPVPPAPPPQTQKQQRGVQICPACGAENMQGEATCIRCGNPLIVVGSAKQSSGEEGTAPQDPLPPKPKRSRRG